MLIFCPIFVLIFYFYKADNDFAKNNVYFQIKVKKTNESMMGKLVQHAEMGAGVVIEDNGAIVTVAFKTRGIKKVARDFLKIIG